MDRFTLPTTREEVESLPTCWECGDACEELSQAPWTGQRLLVGACCLPSTPFQSENIVTPEEAALLDAEELAIFGVPYREIAVSAIRKQAASAVSVKNQEVA